jgi:1,4-alpha-glucan branching enzyme
MGKRNKKKAEGLSWGAKEEGLYKQRVHFIFQAPEANEVYLAGEFNGWHTQTLPMMKGENGLWKADMELPAGRYEYKLFVDGAWMEHRSCEVEVERGSVELILESDPVMNSYGTVNYVLYL